MLLGPILGSVLRMRGVVSLHACVLEVASRAVVVAGRSGAGKSTVAATLARLGHAVLSDDVAALGRNERGTWIAHPGYPRLRLEPETLQMVGADVDGLDTVQTSLPKRYLELSDGRQETPWRFWSDPLPLAAVYVLERDGNVASPGVERLHGPARMETLLGQVRDSSLRLEQATRAAEWEQLARLAGEVEVRRLLCPEGLDSVSSTCQALVRDVTRGTR